MRVLKVIIYLTFIGLLIGCNTNSKKNVTHTQTVQILEESPFQKVDTIQLAGGELWRINKFKSKYVSSRSIDVWLPENYSKNTKYKVLMMHDGQMLFDSTTTWNGQEWGVDEKLTRLLKFDSIKPTIAVAIWSVLEDRHFDYFPQAPFESLDDDVREDLIDYNQKNSELLFKKMPRSDNYLKFLTQEVIPLVENYFSVSNDQSSYTIAGASMGGLISFYALCEYPEVFGQSICMSTHWPGAIPYNENPFPDAFFDYLDQKLPKLKNHKFYFDFGTKTLDELYPQYEDKVNAIFRKYGFDETNFKNIKFIGDAHDEDSWRRRLHIPLKFTLK